MQYHYKLFYCTHHKKVNHGVPTPSLPCINLFVYLFKSSFCAAIFPSIINDHLDNELFSGRQRVMLRV